MSQGAIDPRQVPTSLEQRQARADVAALAGVERLARDIKPVPRFSTVPTLGSGWANFDNGYGGPRTMRDGALKHLRGLAKVTNAVTFGGTRQTICTVTDPPDIHQPFTAHGYVTGVGYCVVQVDVTSGGAVNLVACITPTGVTTAAVDSFVALNGIYWRPA